MTKKKTQEYVCEKFKEKDFILLDNYINSKTKMLCIDKFGYKYNLSLGDITDKRYKKSEKVSRYNKNSNYNINLFLKLNNSNSYLLNDYIDEKSDLLLKCECGEKYITNWNHISNLNNLKCKKCAEKQRHINKKLKVNEINKIFKNSKYKLIEYDNAHNITVEDEEGYMYNTSIYNINKNLYKFHKNNKYTIDNIKLYIKKNNILTNILFDEIKQEHINVRNYYFACSCSECERKYYATLYQIINENRHRCERCSKKESSLEFEVRKYLEEKNIKYIQQKTFIGCKMKRLLPFDFYLTDYNCVIEVNGRQHYYEVKKFNRTLKEQKQYDDFKRKYCFENDIIYIEIPYYNIKNKNYKMTIDNILG